MGYLATTITNLGQRSMSISEKMLEGVPAERFASKPIGTDGRLIDMNHPAFHYGHLAIYASRILTLCELPPTPAAVPADYEAIFAAGKPCEHDPERRIYPAMNAITEVYFRVHRAAYEGIANVPDEVFQRPVPGAKTPSSAGQTILFLTTSHIMMHMGQLSSWRRCMGLASVGI
jgi:DinB superfamily